MDAIYRFDWSPPCRVPVRERTEKRGNTSVMTYVIDLRPLSSGALELHMTDFAFLEVNGQDATEPVIREAIRPALAMASAVPAMEISVEGRYLAVRDFERMLDTLETMRAQQGASPEELARVRAMMNAPTVRRMLEEQAGQYWRTWVESWLDWSLPPGETHEEQRVFTLPGGGQGPVTVHTEHLGFVEGRARLRLTNEIRGSALTALIGPALEQIAREANWAGSLEGFIRDGSRQLVITVETDPSTLRPHHTRYEMTVECSSRTASVTRNTRSVTLPGTGAQRSDAASEATVVRAFAKVACGGAAQCSSANAMTTKSVPHTVITATASSRWGNGKRRLWLPAGSSA